MEGSGTNLQEIQHYECQVVKGPEEIEFDKDKIVLCSFLKVGFVENFLW